MEIKSGCREDDGFSLLGLNQSTVGGYMRNIIAAVLFSIACMPLLASECSTEKILRLSKQGKTIAAIAEMCDMSKADVRIAISEGSSENEVDEDRLPKGTPVGQCGCWGPAHPSNRVPAQQCTSGQAKPRMCNFMCPAGGYAWQGVCA